MYNPWDQIFKIGVPDDLKEPAPIFNKFVDIIGGKYNANNINILDIACGSGRHSLELAKKGYSVSAFDLSHSGIEIFKSKIIEEDLNNIFLAESDMFETFPYLSESFNAAIAIQAIYHGMPNQMENAIKETSRVLKKGGIFFFTVSTELERSMLGANRFLYKKVDEKVFLPLTGREKGLIHYYPNEKDIEDLLRPYFTDVRIYNDVNTKYIIVSCEKV